MVPHTWPLPNSLAALTLASPCPSLCEWFLRQALGEQGSASPRNLLVMQIPGPTTHLLNQKVWPRILCFNTGFQGILMKLKFKNYSQGIIVNILY